VRLDVTFDGVFEIGDGFENATADFLAGDYREKLLDRIEPRRRSRREMERPTWVVRQLRQDFGMFVGGVFGGDGMNDFPGRRVPLDGIEEANEFLTPAGLHAALDDCPIKDIARGRAPKFGFSRQ